MQKYTTQSYRQEQWNEATRIYSDKMGRWFFNILALDNESNIPYNIPLLNLSQVLLTRTIVDGDKVIIPDEEIYFDFYDWAQFDLRDYWQEKSDLIFNKKPGGFSRNDIIKIIYEIADKYKGYNTRFLKKMLEIVQYNPITKVLYAAFGC